MNRNVRPTIWSRHYAPISNSPMNTQESHSPGSVAPSGSVRVARLATIKAAVSKLHRGATPPNANMGRNTMQMAKSQGAIRGTAQIVPSLWLYNNLLPLNVHLVLRKTPVSIYILVLYIYKQFKSGLAAPPLGEVTCYSVYILTLSFIFFLFIIYRTER